MQGSFVGSHSFHEWFRILRMTMPIELEAAAHEVDDFQPVAFVEVGTAPFVAGSDFTVEFDGDAVGLHAELFDEGGQC